jgi:arginine N-succinyltransferase
VTARTDNIRTVREAREEKIAEIGDAGTVKVLAAAGRLKDFRACCASVKKLRKGIMIDAEAAGLLEVEVGDTVLTVAK